MDAGLMPGTEAVPARWEHLTRGTQRVVRGQGRSPEEALEQAAVALCALVTEPARVEVREEVEVECDGEGDLDGLLAGWLRALLHDMAARRLRFRCFAVRLDGRSLFGLAFGEHVDPGRHGAAGGVRGIVPDSATVRRGADGRWTAECGVEV